jgi:hypothetical protein
MNEVAYALSTVRAIQKIDYTLEPWPQYAK